MVCLPILVATKAVIKSKILADASIPKNFWNGFHQYFYGSYFFHAITNTNLYLV